MLYCRRAGKIRYIGLSLPSPATLRRSHKVRPIAAIQVEYSPFALDIEQKGHLLETARDLGIAVVPYSPDRNFPKVLSLVEKLKQTSAKHNATRQVCPAYLLAQGGDIIPISGTKGVKYLEQNLGAADVSLAPEEIKAVRQASTETELTGNQYPPKLMEMLYRDTPELPNA
ncbi:hypothetical protein FRC10_009929 [Ceratobasidium sp. 414]|nr:hypothetical protein FRC10_009929 [Ceratobasidium sp. 414]